MGVGQCMASMGAAMASAILCIDHNHNTVRRSLAAHRPLRGAALGAWAHIIGCLCACREHTWVWAVTVAVAMMAAVMMAGAMAATAGIDAFREWDMAARCRQSQHPRVPNSLDFFFRVFELALHHAVGLAERSPNPPSDSKMSNLVAGDSIFRFLHRHRRGT